MKGISGVRGSREKISLVPMRFLSDSGVESCVQVSIGSCDRRARCKTLVYPVSLDE